MEGNWMMLMGVATGLVLVVLIQYLLRGPRKNNKKK